MADYVMMDYRGRPVVRQTPRDLVWGAEIPNPSSQLVNAPPASQPSVSSMSSGSKSRPADLRPVTASDPSYLSLGSDVSLPKKKGLDKDSLSQAMIAAGLALSKNAGKSYSSRSEANAAPMKSLSEGIAAFSAAYRGAETGKEDRILSVAEKQGAIKAKDAEAKNHLSAANKNIYETSDLNYQRDLNLKKSGGSERYYDTMANKQTLDAVKEAKKTALAKARIYLNKPGLFTADASGNMVFNAMGKASPEDLQNFTAAYNRGLSEEADIYRATGTINDQTWQQLRGGSQTPEVSSGGTIPTATPEIAKAYAGRGAKSGDTVEWTDGKTYLIP